MTGASGLRLLLVLAISCWGLLTAGWASAAPLESTGQGARDSTRLPALTAFGVPQGLVAAEDQATLKGCPAARRGSTSPRAEAEPRFYRYLSAAEFEAICQTGLLRGGRPGETFWGAAAFSSAAEAQDRYALPTRPALRIEFRILNSPSLSRAGSLVAPAFGGRGGEREWASLDPVEVEVLDVVPLE